MNRHRVQFGMANVVVSLLIAACHKKEDCASVMPIVDDTETKMVGVATTASPDASARAKYGLDAASDATGRLAGLKLATDEVGRAAAQYGTAATDYRGDLQTRSDQLDRAAALVQTRRDLASKVAEGDRKIREGMDALTPNTSFEEMLALEEAGVVALDLFGRGTRLGAQLDPSRKVRPDIKTILTNGAEGNSRARSLEDTATALVEVKLQKPEARTARDQLVARLRDRAELSRALARVADDEIKLDNEEHSTEDKIQADKQSLSTAARAVRDICRP